MKFSPLLDEMMKALQVLPGVGPKSAQRMAFTLLERERSGRPAVSPHLLKRALDRNGHCSHCRAFTEERSLRDLRQSQARGERPALRGGESGGRRHRADRPVLRPLLCDGAPMRRSDGIGPEELGLEIPERRPQDGYQRS